MDAATDWHWGVSNAGPSKLLLWLEPWAEEFEVSNRSTLTLQIMGSQANDGLVDVEDTGVHLVVWAPSGGLIRVYIDQVFQDSGSAVIPVPEELGISMKQLLEIAFDNQPQARLGGRAFAARSSRSIWHRIIRRLTIW